MGDTTTDFTEITYRVTDRIATVTLNRPEARNGYTVRMADELAAAFDRADRDPEVRVVVLTGEGKDFSVGADLSQGGFDFDPDTGPDAAWQEPAGRCSKRIFTMDKPVIAALHGSAVGGGLTITLSADYRLAAADSRFGFVFTRRGIYPEGASAWFLPRLVGMGRAMDWMISGRLFDAAEAEQAGLVHRVHDPAGLLDAAYALAADLAANTAPVSVAVTRQLLYRMSALDSPAPVHEVDSKLIASIGTNPDAAEGVLSFLQKRRPRFTLSPDKDLPDFLPWSH
ncbi:MULTISPECIES: enoyl-CoA hydratase-related protein [Prauserella salsuginis group]|uniref:Enoyl-CoA hydratase/carnithine racemase n=2 Tax=Prauserella salsuginis group TaxID=2893672 RepID=A0A839XTV3_9PSEU|nr:MULTISPECIES: enoyl-CoA hydratase-related protein [Prauserella salsuginis group]MBB3666151.1 enoyl-CoA hydratase/carnithine racemase [Prauserella sediminis]MCR3722947.1 Enoyl-CoA hydratase/carnithine racemase [Prauserella flava]MCR3737377.1 Enoyl-CoA hydratase/carnithine racemase [Prauserella salsuginis]